MPDKLAIFRTGAQVKLVGDSDDYGQLKNQVGTVVAGGAKRLGARTYQVKFPEHGEITVFARDLEDAEDPFDRFEGPSARSSGSGRPFEGKMSLKKLMPEMFSSEQPNDYEPCGYCGFDHGYEYEAARAWHEQNDPDGSLYEAASVDESKLFDRFMDRIVVQESPKPRLLVEGDSKQRVRAARHQERPSGRITYKSSK